MASVTWKGPSEITNIVDQVQLLYDVENIYTYPNCFHSKKYKCHWCDECQKVQTLTRRGVWDAAAGLGLHFLHMSEGPFLHDDGHIMLDVVEVI